MNNTTTTNNPTLFYAKRIARLALAILCIVTAIVTMVSLKPGSDILTQLVSGIPSGGLIAVGMFMVRDEVSALIRFARTRQ